MRGKEEDRACRKMGVTGSCSAVKEMGGFFFQCQSRPGKEG